MKKILVSTVGFDEKFVIRALIRYLEEIEGFIGIVALPLEQRALQAIDSVKEFIEKYIRDREKSFNYSFVEIDLSDPYAAISRIKRIFRPEYEYILNLSGGMRALVVATLVAFGLSRVRGSIEIELENFLGRIVLDSRILSLGPLTSGEERRIINVLARVGRATYKDLIRETGIPRATIFKYLSTLRIRGVITIERVGRTTYYILTDIGRTLVE